MHWCVSWKVIFRMHTWRLHNYITPQARVITLMVWRETHIYRLEKYSQFTVWFRRCFCNINIVEQKMIEHKWIRNICNNIKWFLYVSCFVLFIQILSFILNQLRLLFSSLYSVCAERRITTVDILERIWPPKILWNARKPKQAYWGWGWG